MTEAAPTPSQSTRSTVLNHTVPPFYACYLLQSYSEKKGIKGRTYIGSTPDPPRRFKQHNGHIKGGAFKTRMGRPWEMEMIVYGFPSKLQALQFEWAWQNPHASRHLHLRPPAGEGLSATPSAVFPRTTLSNKPTTKVQVLQYMLTVPPWSHFDLKITVFSKAAEEWWREGLAKGAVVGTSKAKNKLRDGWGHREAKIKSVPSTQKLDGVDGNRAERARGRTMEEPSSGEDNPAKITVDDYTFARPQWAKWQSITTKSYQCGVCTKFVSTESHLEFLICASDTEHCSALFHLPCLASHFLGQSASLLPTEGRCPRCRTSLHWQQLIRASFRRSEAELGKGLGKVKGKRTKKGASKIIEESSSDGESDEESPREEEDDEDVFAFEDSS